MGSWRERAPYLCMIIMQLGYGGAIILSKLALEEGLSYSVLVVYRHMFAPFILGPLAHLLERKQRPSLTLPILAKIFVLALFGTTISTNLYYAGLDYTTPTVASAMSNATPAATFVLALLLRCNAQGMFNNFVLLNELPEIWLIFRMEKVRMNPEGLAKILGTVICISGAIIMTFWKGNTLGGIIKTPLIVVEGHGRVYKEDWVKGSTLILTSYVSFCLWLILQAKVYKDYPARISMNALICFFGTLQSTAYALVFERSSSAWQLGWNVKLLAVIYCGTVISCMVYYIQTFCITVRGPVFVAIFSPLLLVVVMIFSSLFLAEQFHLGSLIGAFVIVLGLYTVLWGKSKEAGETSEDIKAKELELKISSLENPMENDNIHEV